MDYRKIMFNAIESILSFEGMTIDVNNMDKLKQENGLIIDVDEWIVNNDVNIFGHGNGFDQYMILITLCKMLESGELEIVPTDKCTEKHINYIKKLTKVD